MKIDLQHLQDYREDNRLEAKLAQKGLPTSLWETYSAFANTDGGLILLGVKELDNHKLEVMGVDDPEKLVSDFWNAINNPQKVNVNVLTNQCISTILVDGKAIVAIDVPRADRTMKPVYLGVDPMKGSYRRNGEGDYHCNKDQVAAMYRDAAVVGADLRVLSNMDMSVFDMALSGGVSDSRNSVIMKMFALIDKVERAGMGIPQAIDSWQELLSITPHYQVTYNPERTTVSLKIEVFEDGNVHKDDHNDLKVQIKDQKVQIKEPKNGIKDGTKNGTKDGTKNGTKILTNRQKTIMDILKKDGSITMEILSKRIGVSMRTINREMSFLQKMKRIERVGAKTNGEWRVL